MNANDDTTMIDDVPMKLRRKASLSILTVGVLQLLFAGILYSMMRGAPGAASHVMQIRLSVGIVAGIGVVYFGLYFWARKNPLPAATIGMALYLTILLLESIADPHDITRGLIVKVLILLILGKAVGAGLKYRELTESQDTN